MLDLELRSVSLTHPDARYLVARVQQVYVERYGRSDADTLEPAAFTPPDGGFCIGYLDGLPVASGGWRRCAHAALGSSVTAEIKRMYVVEEHQRRGLARQVLEHLQTEVRAAGIDVLILETGPRQPEAIGLYTHAGFTPIAPFGHYQDQAQAHFFGKRLSHAPEVSRPRST